MRPVRFVALSEDGQAAVLADEVGRLLTLPIDDRVSSALKRDRGAEATANLAIAADPANALSPRDIQARIRSGESADEVARVAGVPVDRVLRYAGPVLQERAMLAQHARRTKLKGQEKNATLAQVVDQRLAQHGVDAEKISWDAYRRDDGTWRIVATWPSGKATAQAMWELDKARQLVSPHDDMSQYLCADKPVTPQAEHGRSLGAPARGETGRGDLTGTRTGHEPMRPAADTARRESRPGRGLGVDPVRSGRDALLASLDRPLDAGEGVKVRSRGSAFDADPDAPMEVPAVPSLAVLRPRRAAAEEPAENEQKPARKRAPSWDDVLFGSAPAARESS
ncbi:MAG TPA: septation protein SepH [Micromonosporaceae bacterium]